MDAVAAEVLARYPAPLRGTCEALGNRGGFSGARLWRVCAGGGPLCLRAGAATETGGHVQVRHRLMRLARDAGLRFVPGVMDATNGETVVEADGRAWELMEWMPGRADFHATPTVPKLQAAARALARVHLAWEGLGGEAVGPCPAVSRRLEKVQARSASEGIPRSRFGLGPLDDTVARWLPRVPEMLRPWHAPRRLQPCLRDVWHDHLLYEGENLTGLIDYAAVAPDSVAADVARLFGSLVEDDDVRWAIGLEAYREVRGFSREEERLARVLDRTGVIVALSNWQRWLGDATRSFEDPAHAMRRVEGLLARLDRWHVAGER